MRRLVLLAAVISAAATAAEPPNVQAATACNIADMALRDTAGKANFRPEVMDSPAMREAFLQDFSKSYSLVGKVTPALQGTILNLYAAAITSASSQIDQALKVDPALGGSEPVTITKFYQIRSNILGGVGGTMLGYCMFELGKAEGKGQLAPLLAQR